MCDRSYVATQRSRTMIHEDNQSCIALANTPKKQTTEKHIATRFHHIREHIGLGSVALSFLATDAMEFTSPKV